jgi:hypothetical protein
MIRFVHHIFLREVLNHIYSIRYNVGGYLYRFRAQMLAFESLDSFLLIYCH